MNRFLSDDPPEFAPFLKGTLDHVLRSFGLFGIERPSNLEDPTSDRVIEFRKAGGDGDVVSTVRTFALGRPVAAPLGRTGIQIAIEKIDPPQFRAVVESTSGEWGVYGDCETFPTREQALAHGLCLLIEEVLDVRDVSTTLLEVVVVLARSAFRSPFRTP